MTQARRVSPRIPYDEAICLARIDGKGRLYGRGLDLSASGISLVSTESCPIGTEIKCDLLLPHGPRSVTGKIVRVTAAPGGFELAVAFGEIKPAVAAVIANLIADRTKQVLPAKLRIDGVDKPLRCEAHVDEQIVRLTATLPFLRLDGGVDVVLGERAGLPPPGPSARSPSIRRPATASRGWRSTSRSTTSRAPAPSATGLPEPRPPRRSAAPPPAAAHQPAAPLRAPAAVGGGGGGADPATSGRSRRGRRGGGCTAPPRSCGARISPPGPCARRRSWRPSTRAPRRSPPSG